ncbi:MAG: hypothetical protein QM639_05805 [Rhodocyclaceae bacterium]
MPRRPRALRPPEGTANNFVRGFATTGLLLALQPHGGTRGRALLHHALRGGTALAAGVAIANAVERGEYGRALVAAAAGAAGLIAIDRAARCADASENKESHHG